MGAPPRREGSVPVGKARCFNFVRQGKCIKCTDGGGPTGHRALEYPCRTGGPIRYRASVDVWISVVACAKNPFNGVCTLERDTKIREIFTLAVRYHVREIVRGNYPPKYADVWACYEVKHERTKTTWQID